LRRMFRFFKIKRRADEKLSLRLNALLKIDLPLSFPRRWESSPSLPVIPTPIPVISQKIAPFYRLGRASEPDLSPLPAGGKIQRGVFSCSVVGKPP